MNLQKLISLRSGNRSVISKLLGKIEEAKEKSNMIEFNATLEAFESKTKTLDALNEKILSQTEVEDIEEELVTTEEYTLELEIQLRQLRAFRREASGVVRDQTRLQTDDHSSENAGNHAGINPDRGNDRREKSNSTDGADSGETGSRVKNIHIAGSQNSLGNNHSFMSASLQYHRLPKLSLPSFNGDILSWQTFWDSFESTVHLNCNLTDVQKFSYLKSQLEGEAIQTIDGFALTNTNYARATELLKERYGQKHKIIHATMQALLQLPAPRNTLHCIREFYDKMETYIRALESMGQQQETYGDLLVPIVLDKLPGEMRKHLARGHGDSNWLLYDLRRAIHKEINIMEAGSCNLIQPEVEPYGSAASLFTGAKGNRGTDNSHRRRTEIKCALCEDSHVARNCRKWNHTDRLHHYSREQKVSGVQIIHTGGELKLSALFVKILMLPGIAGSILMYRQS